MKKIKNYLHDIKIKIYFDFENNTDNWGDRLLYYIIPD